MSKIPFDGIGSLKWNSSRRKKISRYEKLFNLLYYYLFFFLKKSTFNNINIQSLEDIL